MRFMCENCKRLINVSENETTECCGHVMIPERKCVRCGKTGFDVYHTFTPIGEGKYCVPCREFARKQVVQFAMDEEEFSVN